MSILLNETKTIQTANKPLMIDHANRRNGFFGWNVQSVQITHVKDSHLEFQENLLDIEIRSVTETTEYATITYTRDRGLPHLTDLRALEKEYAEQEEILHAQKVIQNENKPVFSLAIVSVIGFLCCIGAGGTWLAFALLCGFGGLAATILLNMMRSPRREAAAAVIQEASQKMTAIEEKCENLLLEIMG